MFHNLIEHPAVHRTLEEISQALHSGVRNLDTEHCLEFSVSVQLAVFASGVSSALALMDEGIRPVAVSGLSVGAFASAVTAGVLGLREAVELVRLRAEEMTKLYPNGYGLSAILALTEVQVTRIVEAATTPNSTVYAGNINAPRQIVIAGANFAMDKVLEEALRQGARKAVRFMCQFYLTARCFSPWQTNFKNRFPRYLSARQQRFMVETLARALRKKQLVSNDLASNIAHGVRWHNATTVLKELGCSLFLEMPPGHVLSDLLKRISLMLSPYRSNRGSLLKIGRVARRCH